MEQFAEVTQFDVIFIYTAILAIDALWEEAYGQDIEYEYRQIPAYLIYLKVKYPAVPHWLLLDTVMDNSKVGEDKAAEMIRFCVKADMFSVKEPDGDRRQMFYEFTKEQKAKLLKTRRGEALAYQLAVEQAKQPSNLDAGRTEENKSWFRHALNKVFDRNERYQANMRRIEKLKHLFITLMIVLLSYGWLIDLARALTADKGHN